MSILLTPSSFEGVPGIPTAAAPSPSQSRKRSVAFDNEDDDTSYTLGSKDSSSSNKDEESYANWSDIDTLSPAGILKNSSPASTALIPTPTPPAADLDNLLDVVDKMAISDSKKKLFKTPPRKPVAALPKDPLELALHLPNFFYLWKDKVRNKLVTYEILLPSGTKEEQVGMRLVEGQDGRQVLRISVEYSPLFLANDYFKNNCTLENETDSVNRFSARVDRLLQLEKMYLKHDEVDQLVGHQDLPVPFPADNPFQLHVGEKAYANTGHMYRIIPLTDIVGNRVSQMDILIVTLVEAERRISKPDDTPSKKSEGQAVAW